MELNSKKSFVMWFMPRRCRHSGSVEQPDIVINNRTLQATAKQKYLGLIFDNRLTWTSHMHVSNICKNISYYLRLVGLYKLVLPIGLIKLLMDSLVLPHILYALSVWGPFCTNSAYNICKDFRIVQYA